MNIGNNLKKLLKEKGMKQIDLSELTGFTTKHISNIVTGKVDESMPIGTLQLLADALNVSITYFFEETNIEDNSQSSNTGDINLTSGNGNQFITGSNIKNSNIKSEAPKQHLTPKYQQILNLLPYANEAFLNKLIENLSKTKEDQDKLFK